MYDELCHQHIGNINQLYLIGLKKHYYVTERSFSM